MIPARHIIPTGLAVEDRFITYGAFALSLRQCFLLLGGAATGYGGVWQGLSSLPVPLRLGAALTPSIIALTVAFVRPGGRQPEDWLFILARYWCLPRRTVWRPRAPEPVDWASANTGWAGTTIRPLWLVEEPGRAAEAGAP
jgi:hypothetical protein